MPIKAKLFITCLGEQFFPNVLKDMVKLLERLGVVCKFPEAQTCCGQPFYNSGFQNQGRDLARRWLRAFGAGDPDAYIVAPSGSCVDFVKHHYAELFPEDRREHEQAKELAARTYEFSQFVVNVLKVTNIGAAFPHSVTFHAPCHALRGLGVRDEPKQLLRAVKGLELVPLNEEETCCGFGGVFSVVYPEVSKAMMEAKVANVQASGAEVVVISEPGCLMNVGGGLHKVGSPIRAMHLIEILASDGGVR
jgi:L-lactate dehydrogenase complex protein LldE